MAYFCKECHQPYERHQFRDLLYPITDVRPISYNLAPCECGGDIVEIDDLIFPAIFELNKKGWKTTNCCSEHLYNFHGPFNTYLSFKKEDAPPTTPEGFVKEESADKEKSSVAMYYTYNYEEFQMKNYLQRLSTIYEVNYKLAEWAMSLPYK